jgi:hypothetical protein
MRMTDNMPIDPFEEPGYPGLTTSKVEARATQDNDKGMHDKYVVLSKEERQKGFIRPLRRSYIHKKCGVATRMSLPLCETYARDPKFYGATFCCSCNTHLPVEEFEWEDGDTVGS